MNSYIVNGVMKKKIDLYNLSQNNVQNKFFSCMEPWLNVTVNINPYVYH